MNDPQNLLAQGANLIADVPQRLRAWPEWIDVTIALAALLILSAIPSTSRLAIWVAVAILFLQLTIRKAG